MPIELPTSPVLDQHDWDEAFRYADPARLAGSGGQQVPGFTQDDIAEVLAWHAQSDGSTSERYYGDLDLVAVFRLTDGRYASLHAWCDTTGWGCQEGGTAHVATMLDIIIRQGLTDDERDRLSYQ